MKCIRQKKNRSFKRLYFTKLRWRRSINERSIREFLQRLVLLERLAIDGLKAWVLFLEEDDVIRVRLRSKGPVINKLAMQYNGGGIRWLLVRKASSWEEADRLLLIYVRFVNKRLYVRTKRRSAKAFFFSIVMLISSTGIKRYCIDFKTI